ncbi:N-acetyltransferase family protein [Luminiphilus sp. nBUS_16]|uniref:GNAT family N-acetyltransferase n=1 Tax=Luminiphilus sp. nBUS_16 TaxID=3395315 RepID=UPI003EB74E87
MSPQFQYREAALPDLKGVASLFDAYRQFYSCEPALESAEAWLSTNFTDRRSTVFVAEDEAANLVGFTQLYPALCSVDLVRYFVLYDLYVDQSHRRMGLGRGLMAAAQSWALAAGGARIELETARNNVGAQALYETLGYEKDDVFYKYSLELK